jgi:BlaI family transcriptional regulator, penicillinase repressor
MPRTARPLPTPSELEILQVIWLRGPSTVREVYRTLAQSRTTGYSTVLKFMQIMTDKGMLVRDESVRPQMYRPAQPQRHVQKGIVQDLVARAFGGSSFTLVMQALSDSKANDEERRQIRALLDSLNSPGSRRRKP